MKVLVADKFEKSGLEGLRSAGCEVAYEPDAKDDALAQAIEKSGAEVLVVRSTKVTRAMLEAGKLGLVVRAGAGYNTIDVEAASERGIYVANCPGKNSIAVAELAFGLILALDRRIVDNASDLKRGVSNKKEYSKAKGLFGATLGLVGVGGIGKEMIPRARAFGMPVVAWSRSLTAEKAEQLGIERKETALEVARAADIVSVHVALKPDTRMLIGPEFFAAMRDRAYFINTSRGETVDQQALVDAIHAKGLRAGLDVFSIEPTSAVADFTDPIANETRVYGTHHIGASTDQAQEAIAAETVRIIKSFKETGQVPNVVNLAARTPATHRLVVRHRDRPGVLAQVLDAIKAEQINVQEMENIVFEGAQAAVARINLDKAPSNVTLDRLRAGNEDVIELNVLEIG